MGIPYKTFRQLFNKTNSTEKIRVFIHIPDAEYPVITFLNTYDEFDEREVTRVEWSILKDDSYDPMIQADVWVK